jgi:hypothetical protein
VRNAVVLVVVFGLAGVATASILRAPKAPQPGCALPSAAYHTNVSPAIAALQAQERVAFDRGDEAAAREFERQVQATLVEEQHAEPHRQPVNVVEPGAGLSLDEEIFSGGVTALSADYEMDGTMWAAFAGAADSTIHIYKSVDHGSSWDPVLAYNSPPVHYVAKIELVVGPGDSGFVYLFENLPSDNGDLSVVRCDKSGGQVYGFAVRVGPDTITDFTACRDYSGSGYWLYAISYNGQQSGDWPAGYLMRSTNYGITWAETDRSANKARPRMAFGGSSICYAVAVPEPHAWQGLLQTGVSANWSSPGSWRFYDYRPDTLPVNDACIAPAFTAPVESATVWLAYSHYSSSGDYDVLSAYATDTLLGWVGPSTVANTSHDEGYVDLRNYASPGNPYVNLSYCDIDLAMHDNAWLGYSSSGAPGTWTALSNPWVNQSGYIGWGFTLFPRVVYSPGGPGTGGGLVFAGATRVNGYFNAPWLTGVAETAATPPRPSSLSVRPSVAHGPVRVSWSGNASRLVITDVAGRVVTNVAAPAGNSFVWNHRVPTGTYLVCLTMGMGTATRPLVIR